MQDRATWKTPNLLCLEMMPFCGFNTWPSYCALVSPAISSNLVTLNWILCMGPSVLWERHTLFSQQRGYSGVVAFWIALHLTSPTRTAGVTFHFLLATGKRSIPRRGWLPSPLCCRTTTHPPRQMVNSCYRVNRWSRSRSDAPTHTHIRTAIKPLRPTFIITVKWRAECLTSCFPLICLLIFH